MVCTAATHSAAGMCMLCPFLLKDANQVACSCSARPDCVALWCLHALVVLANNLQLYCQLHRQMLKWHCVLQSYTTLAKDMEKNSDEWEKWCLLEASEKAPMPGDWGKISDFRQLLIIRALKPGRITNALQVRCNSRSVLPRRAIYRKATCLLPHK